MAVLASGEIDGTGWRRFLACMFHGTVLKLANFYSLLQAGEKPPSQMVGAESNRQSWLAMGKAMLTWQKGLTLKGMAVELSSSHHFSSDGLLLPLVTTAAISTPNTYGTCGQGRLRLSQGQMRATLGRS